MDAFAYRDMIEDRFFHHMSSAGTRDDSDQVLKRTGPSFRGAFGEVVDWVAPEDRPTAKATPIGVALLGGVNAVALRSPK